MVQIHPPQPSDLVEGPCYEPAPFDFREDSKLPLPDSAVCFSESGETYHHWRVFANGSSGVCIKFKRGSFLKALRKQPGLRMHQVKYLTLDEIKGMTLSVKDLPFLKRYAYEDECEFRVIYESDSTKARKLDIPIPISCIDKITLSPWMHPDLSSYTKRVLHGIDACKSLDIVRSTLIGNETLEDSGRGRCLSRKLISYLVR